MVGGIEFFKVSKNSCKDIAIQRRGVEANGALALRSYLLVGDIQYMNHLH